MKHIKKMKIDIDKSNFEVIPSVQYDSNTRFLHINLTNGSIPFDLTGCSVKISGTKQDGTAIFNNCTIINAKKGFVEVELTEQINAIPGTVKCELKIYSESGVLTTKHFDIEVTAPLTASKEIVSSNEFKALTDALKVVQGIDNKADKEKVEEKFGEVYEQLDKIIHKQEFYTLFLDDYSKYVVNSDWGIAINKAINEPYDIHSKYYGKKIKIEFNPNVNYIIKSKILYNPTLVEIVGNQSKIEVQGMNEDFNVAFEINTEAKYATTFISLKSLKSLYIKGEGLPNTIGVLFKNCADLISSHIRVERFGKNVYIENNAYLLSFFHCNIGDAKEYAVYIPSNLLNYGERITFIDCNLGNSNKSVYNGNPDGDLFFTNCSFDYNREGVVDNINGKTYFTDCHFEHSIEVLSSFVICTGGVVQITNGYILGTGVIPKLNYFASGGGRVSLYNVFIHNLKTSSNQLCEEKTYLIMEKTDCYPIHETSFFTNQKNNIAINHNNNGIINDLICIIASDGVITDKHSSPCINITSDNNGILIKKTYGYHSTAGFALFFPIKNDFFINSNKFKISKLNNAGSGGYITIEKGICYLDTTSSIPKILKKKTIGYDYNVNFEPNSAKEWTEVKSTGMVDYSERWASHFYIKFNLLDYDGNSNNAFINIKDLWFEYF